MDLIVYCPETCEFGTELIARLQEVSAVRRIPIHGTPEELAKGLQRSSDNPRAALLLLPTRQDLTAILPSSELLHSVPVVLVLPDSEEETVARGLLLRPRFLTWSNAKSTNSLVSVVRKLQRNMRTELLSS